MRFSPNQICSYHSEKLSNKFQENCSTQNIDISIWDGTFNVSILCVLGKYQANHKIIRRNNCEGNLQIIAQMSDLLTVTLKSRNLVFLEYKLAKQQSGLGVILVDFITFCFKYIYFYFEPLLLNHSILYLYSILVLQPVISIDSNRKIPTHDSKALKLQQRNYRRYQQIAPTQQATSVFYDGVV